MVRRSFLAPEPRLSRPKRSVYCRCNRVVFLYCVDKLADLELAARARIGTPIKRRLTKVPA
jgi:hypothetical protein